MTVDQDLSPGMGDGAMDVSIHPMNPDEADGVSQLMREAYRGTYPKKFVYNPEQLRYMTESGDLFSVVGTGPEGEVIGYGALRAYPGYPEIGLMGSLVVSPAYRNGELGRNLARYLADYSEKRGFPALTAEVSTSHPSFQQAFEGLGFFPSAVILGAQPHDISYGGIAEHPGQRESVAFLTRLRSSVRYRPQYLPENHQEIIGEICRALGLLASPGKEGVSRQEPTIIEESFSEETRSGQIVVRSSGYNFRRSIAQTLWNLRARGEQSIWMHLDASVPSTPAAATAAEDAGFIFSGILPGKKGLILLHQFTREKICCDQIHLPGPLGTRLLAYIDSQRKPDLPRRQSSTGVTPRAHQPRDRPAS